MTEKNVRRQKITYLMTALAGLATLVAGTIVIDSIWLAAAGALLLIFSVMGMMAKEEHRTVKLNDGTVLHCSKKFPWREKWTDDYGNRWVRRNNRFYIR